MNVSFWVTGHFIATHQLLFSALVCWRTLAKISFLSQERAGLSCNDSLFTFSVWDMAVKRGTISKRLRRVPNFKALFFFSLLLFLVLQNSILIFASTEIYRVYRKKHWYVFAIVSLEHWQTLVCEANLIQMLISSSSEGKKCHFESYRSVMFSQNMMCQVKP